MSNISFKKETSGDWLRVENAKGDNSDKIPSDYIHFLFDHFQEIEGHFIILIFFFFLENSFIEKED